MRRRVAPTEEQVLTTKRVRRRAADGADAVQAVLDPGPLVEDPQRGDVAVSRLAEAPLATAQRQSSFLGVGRMVGNRSLAQAQARRVRPSATVQAQPAAEGGIIQRWGEEEHKTFGDLAAQMTMKHDWSFQVGDQRITPKGVGAASDAVVEDKKSYDAFITGKVDPLKKELGAAIGPENLAAQGVGVTHNVNQKRWTPFGMVTLPWTKPKTMSFGDATMLGGDYFTTAKGGLLETAGLSQAQTVNPKEMEGIRMKYVAATNTNHFFPLAEKEWHAQRATARAHALEAHEKYLRGDKAGGDSSAETALQYLGVAAHFLQDTFASGHQYPRALDDIGSSTAAGTALEGAGPAKTYHDALCALPNGMPMLYGGGRRFHGDFTANASDVPVVHETYRALVDLLTVIKTGKAAAVQPTPNPGPDVKGVMADPEAGPIWASMVSHLEEDKLPTARQAAAKGKAGYSTSAGTGYSAQEIMDAWNGLGGRVRTPSTQTDKLVDAALRGQSNWLHSATKEGNTGVGKSLDTEADDKIVALVKAGGAPKLSQNQTMMVLEALISGVCTDEDEEAVLRVLNAQDDKVFQAAVNSLTPDYIDSGLDGEEWDAFLALCAQKYDAGRNVGAALIASEKNDNAARMLFEGAPHGILSLPATGGMGRLSGAEWIGVINALLSGACTDADEDCIVAIVQHMASTGQAGLVHSQIGPSRMDGGVDGKQWEQIRAIMKSAGYNWSWWG